MSGTDDPGAPRDTAAAATPGPDAPAVEPEAAPASASEAPATAGGEAGAAPVQEATSGVADVAANPQVPQARAKTKGVADIVFLIDCQRQHGALHRRAAHEHRDLHRLAQPAATRTTRRR